MKRLLSFILAALLLASSVVSCGKTEPAETNAAETKAEETLAADTSAPETTAPEAETAETAAPADDYAYDTALITENGVAKSHIVLLDGASEDEKTAADELAYHIKLVSGGAEVAITNTVQADSLPIIIATPDTLPELETMFPEDLAWLRDTGTPGNKDRSAPDGFAIRWIGDDPLDGKIYIFGAIPAGALNGVYDFIEDNLGVLWIKTSNDDIVYDEMPTITAGKVDYREKSPFLIRYNYSSQLLNQRNKYATDARVQGSGHSVKNLVLSSPSYDPNITEYWDTNIEGVHLTASESKQVNYWSMLTADTIADRLIQILDQYDPENLPAYYTVGMEDVYAPSVYPEMTQPFEYAPGQFVEPSAGNLYLSTVYYTFLNRIAQRVKEKYPTVGINTLGCMWSVVPPLCELEENLSIWYCTAYEDYNQPSFSEAYEEALAGDITNWPLEALYYHDWVTKFPKNEIYIYDYHYCHYVGGWYERPIWYRLQNDFQYYAETGCIGTYSDGFYNDTNNSLFPWSTFGRADIASEHPYSFTWADAQAMNILSLWLFYKLQWNPYEDVDALIEYFCDKVYGDASPYMQEYYDLLTVGWNNGSELIKDEFNARIAIHYDQIYYYMYFIDFNLDDGTYYQDAVREVLTKAYEAADDKAKEFIRRPYEVFSEDWSRFVYEN